MPPSRRQRIAIAALLGILLVAGAAVAFRLARELALPDRAALETQLEAAVTGAETMASVVAAFRSDGFACGETGDMPGAWHCEIAEGGTGDRPELEPLDCPMRIMVTLLPDEAGRLARFAVAEGAFCM